MKKNLMMDFKNDKHLIDLLNESNSLLKFVKISYENYHSKEADLRRLQKEMRTYFNEDDEKLSHYIEYHQNEDPYDVAKKFGIGITRCVFIFNYINCFNPMRMKNKNLIDDSLVDYSVHFDPGYHYKRGFNYFNKYPYDSAPDWIASRHFKCVVCGGQPIYFRDDECPYPGCYEASQDALISINVGMGVLDLLHAIDHDRKIEMSEDVYNQIKERINNCLPMYDGVTYGMFDRTPSKFIDKNGNTNLSEEMYKDLAEHYLNEHKKECVPAYISKIQVRGLFAYHNYDLEINNDISVVFGSNALGKTTVFNILKAVLCRTSNKEDLYDNLCYLFKIPFRNMKVEFLNGRYIEIHKNVSTEPYEIYIEYDRSGFDAIGPGVVLYNDISYVSELEKHYDNIDRKYPGINTKNKFLFVKVNRFVDIEKLYKRVDNCIKNSKKDEMNDDIRKIFDDANTPVFVKEFNDSLSTLIRMFRNVSAHSGGAQHAIMSKCNINDLFDSLSNDYESYEDWLDSVTKTSVDKEAFKLEVGPSVLEYFKNYFLFKKCFESFYYDEDPSQKKVAFKDRTICIKAKKNFDDNLFSNTLSFDDLSSGEKNIATVLFNLIFKAKERAIVLIDEPEVSLHSYWQAQFTDVVRKIIEEKGSMQVIVASHSPFITSGDDDVVVIPNLIMENE